MLARCRYILRALRAADAIIKMEVVASSAPRTAYSWHERCVLRWHLRDDVAARAPGTAATLILQHAMAGARMRVMRARTRRHGCYRLLMRAMLQPALRRAWYTALAIWLQLRALTGECNAVAHSKAPQHMPRRTKKLPRAARGCYASARPFTANAYGDMQRQTAFTPAAALFERTMLIWRCGARRYCRRQQA